MYWENLEGMFNFQNIYSDMVNKFNNDSVFVEIGTWKGKSAMYMAEKIKESQKNINFFTIDIFKYIEGYGGKINESFYEETLKNLDPLKKYIKILKGTSQEIYEEFENESIDFLFIDGDHSYEAVKKDLKLWLPKMKSTGIIAGHDYTELTCGVKKAVDETFLPFTIMTNRTSWIHNLNQ